MTSAPRVRSGWHLLLALAVVALASAAVRHDALFARFDPQGAGQRPLLALRGLLLASVFVASRNHRRAPWLLVLTMALVVLSLVVPGGVALLTIVGVGILAWLPAVRLELSRPDVRELAFAGCALALAVTVAVAARPPAYPRLPSPDESPRERTRAWLAADNRHRARVAALAWAKSEDRDPGEGYFALASIDRELGYEERARKVLEKVRTRSSSEDARRRAAELLRESAR